MTCLLDVNILIALLWDNHEQHPKVRAWFKGVSAFATCPVAQLGFARVSSHPLLGYGMTPDNAFGVLRQLLAGPRHRFISDDLSSAERGNLVGVVSAKLSVRAALAAKLKEPETTERKFEEVVKSAEQAAVLVLVYGFARGRNRKRPGNPGLKFVYGRACGNSAVGAESL